MFDRHTLEILLQSIAVRPIEGDFKPQLKIYPIRDSPISPTYRLISVSVPFLPLSDWFLSLVGDHMCRRSSDCCHFSGDIDWCPFSHTKAIRWCFNASRWGHQKTGSPFCSRQVPLVCLLTMTSYSNQR